MSSTYTWRPIGAWTSGTVSAVALSPQFANDGIALAATAAGIFRTTDGGVQWRWSSDGIHDPVVVALAFASGTDSTSPTVFASTAQGRLYRSEDGGAHWREVEAWSGLGVITELALSPAYAQDRSIFAATTDGMFRSQDDGATWESSTFGLLDTEILCMACAPDFAESETLWIGSSLGGLYRSRNAARAWRESGVGLPDAAVQCLLASPTYTADQTLFAGMEQFGVYKSTDRGATWQSASADLANQSINSLVATDQSGRVLLAGTDAGIYRSADGGAHWAPVEEGAFLALSLAAQEGVVLAGTYAEGVWRSPDGGQSWAAANGGIVAHAPPLVRRAADGALWALDVNGILAVSTDGGPQWTALELDAAVETFALADEDEHTQVVAVADGALWLGDAAAVIQTDGAWIEHPAPVAEAALLVLSPAFAQDRTLLLGGVDGSLHRSTDAGESWRGLAAPHADVAPLQAFFAADSDKEGQTLYLVTAAANAQGNYDIGVWETDLQKGADAPAWENVALFETEIPAVLAAAPVDPVEGALFLSTQHRVIKLYTGADGALAVSQSFLEAEEPQTSVRISALAASPHYAQDHTLFAGSNMGVHRSTDRGASWEPLGDGLPPLPVVALLPDVAGSLVAVTLGGGVWRLAV
jgi:photosystem II stability/assembly factor-like uncharacterized protein